MSELTDLGERMVIDFLCNNPECYVGLFTTAPGEAGGGTEVTATINGTGTKPAGNFATASGSSGQVANTVVVDFGVAAGTPSGQVTAFGLFSTATAGSTDMFAYSPLNTPQTISAGNTVSFPIGALTFTMA